MFPEGSPDLEDRAREVVSRSAALGGQLHPITRASVVELLRIINSYYSNLIEGLLVSDSPKGAVRFGIPTPVAGYLFPDLYPGLPDG